MPARSIISIFHQEAILYLALYKGGGIIFVVKQSTYYKPDELSGICVVKRKGEEDEEGEYISRIIDENAGQIRIIPCELESY